MRRIVRRIKKLYESLKFKKKVADKPTVFDMWKQVYDMQDELDKLQYLATAIMSENPKVPAFNKEIIDFYNKASFDLSSLQDELRIYSDTNYPELRGKYGHYIANK